MKKSTLMTVSWAALFVAVLSWCGVGYFAYDLVNMQTERAAHIAQTAAAHLEEGQAALLHALARDTVGERAMLTKAAEADVLTAVNLIEGVRAGNALVKVTAAQAEKVSKGSGPAVNTVLLSIRAEGSFAALMRVAQMLETLPLATTMQAADFSRTTPDTDTKNPSPAWNLDVRLRLFTTATLSS